MQRRIAVLALAVLTPLAVVAQTGPSPYSTVSGFEVPLPHAARFEEAIRQIVDAAQRARLKPESGWGVWQNDNTYAVVSGMQKIAEFDDPNRFMRQFEQTPGQAVLMQALQKLTGIPYREETEVLQYVAEWSYAPSNAPTAMTANTWVEVIEYWALPGMDAQFDAATKEAIGILRSTNYPFVVLGNRTPIGKRRVQFVVVIDDLAKHAAVQDRLEKNPQWQAMGARFRNLVVDVQTSRWRYRPELSYSPM